MDADTLFNLGFHHWQAFLLSFIPAVITLSAIIYFSKFPAYKINRIYLLYLVSIFAWQINDSLSRMSLSEETARSWDRLISFAYILQFPANVHFDLLLLGKKKLVNHSWFIISLYLPAFFFAMLLCGGLYVQSFTYTDFWGWVRAYEKFQSFQMVPLLWACTLIIYAAILLGVFAYKNRKSSEAKFISLFIFIAYLIPIIQGLTTEIVFPLFLKINPMPITSTFMLTVVIVLTQLIAFKIFNLSETIDTERITEILQEIIFVVSPQRTLTYINSYGKSLLETTGIERKQLKDLFPGSESIYSAFERQVIIPAFKENQPAHFQFSMDDRNGKEIHWDAATYPIFNRTNVEGLLVVCRDITDSIHMAETKLVALRSQMNPHFIFNSLNSIQHYIHSNQREEAESFLSTFSTLIRQILDNSASSSISLTEELLTIDLYLKLEKVRFGDRLNYKIHVDNDLELDNVLVPSMLIQPYIENAIIHGLTSKEEGGSVYIIIKKESANIVCIIRDDGVGREKALEIKSRGRIKKKSYGMSITQARLEILNRQLNMQVVVKIIDLHDKANYPCGTQVEICMPLQERF